MSTTEHAKKALLKTKFFPYWLDNKAAPEPEPSLKDNISCDLLIVGAGFTGLWAAIHAKEQNPERDVVIIESQCVAIGASGRPAAILSASVVHGLENADRFFPEDIVELERLGKENMDGFHETIEKYNIDCDIEWGGELTVAVGEEGIPDLEREYRLYKEHGHDAHMLSGEEVRAEINSPLFDGGLWSKQRSGTVHPAKLAWGLKRIAKEKGVRIFEYTPLEDSKHLKPGVLVNTPEGSVKANKVLLATNAFAAGSKKIKSRVAAIRDRIVVSEPLTDEQLATIGWKNRQGVYDTRTQLNYMRLTADNRILFGGRLGYFFNNNTDPKADKSADNFVNLVKNFYKTFPSLTDVKFSHAWSGPIGLTTRMAVHYQSYYKGDMVYAGGYSGFGVTATRFGSRIGLAILDNTGIPETKLKFARTQPNWIPPEPFRWIGAKITMYALDTMDEKGGWRVPWIRLVEKMGFPITQNELG